MSRAGVCTIAVAVVVAGCGSGRQPAAPSSLSAGDAHEVGRLARAYQRTSTAVTARVEARLIRQYNLCPLTRSNPNGAPGRPGEQQFVVLQQAAILQALLPRYLALARKVGSVDPEAPELRAAAHAMTTVAAAYRPLLSADTDYCSILRKWRAQGWKPRFDVASAVGASILMRSPPRKVESAYATLARSALALRAAGATPRDVRRLLRFTRMFWAPV
jgi:hypothetical protein